MVVPNSLTYHASGLAARPRRAGSWRAAFAACVLALVGLAALAGPSLSPHAFDGLDWLHIAAAPQLEGEHWLGTDRLGRDLLVRTLIGTRVSLAIGLLATAVSLIIGVLWGALAGYAGGRTDAVMMRIVDVLHSVPYIFIVIILTTLFERGNIYVLFTAIGAVGWITMARIVRAQTLSLRRKAFIEAAVAGGAGPLRIVTRHIVPNVSGPVLAYAALTVPQMILFESFLSFLGLGVQEPMASLGKLILEGAQEMHTAPWLLLVPASVLAMLLVCFNVMADGLRQALDPHET